ncbi:ATP-grasp domain-containing protein [Anatilimnocola sp. NA78]|uniref:ATP-grasp domain-containing protein n=1 Tax=Anatilimnocola sp. NA78 TaxID=3415683 RepID=UPI003CE4A950
MNARSPLIIVGASARAAAESAARGGFQPMGIDLFADADLRTLGPTIQIERYPAEFLRALSAAPEAPWMYTGSLENYPRLVGRLAKLRPLLGNGPEVVARVRDPRWLASQLSKTELAYPETRFAGDKIASEAGWLIKPIRSAGGMGIRQADAAEGRFVGTRHVYQRYVQGVSLSASFMATKNGVHLLGFAQQWCGENWGSPQPFQFAGAMSPLKLLPADEETIVRAANQLAASAGLRGLFGLDLIRDAERIWLIEVNPRYTASMELLESTTGPSLVVAHCQAFAAEDVSIFRVASTEFHAKLIVYATESGVAGDRLQQLIGELGAVGIQVKDIPVWGTTIDKHSPICTVQIASADRATIANGLVTSAEQICSSLDPPVPVSDPGGKMLSPTNGNS